MRWSRTGAHSVVQPRVALSNGEFHELAQQQFPWIGRRLVRGLGKGRPGVFNGFLQHQATHRPMLGFKSFSCTRIPLMRQTIAKGQMEDSGIGYNRTEQFYSLAA
jgi:hypothetical protein